ncbi:TetR/AcrR family transcriptional regulator [Cupriavidus sp. 2MCAB6]|uniref:TetR/AcrR family transcriptional regulator n=1 Tax=Cupriavidus sp. 2MCAB6 TaxID=3232981 RepID=UPI003F90A0AB
MPTIRKPATRPPGRASTSARKGAPARRSAKALAAGTEQPPAMRPPRQSRSEQNLDKMVKAGRALAEQRGNLDEISLNDVVGAANTSIGAFYARFKDKEAFLAFMLEAALAEAEAITRQSIAEDPVWQTGPASAIVERIVRIYVGRFRQNRGLFKGFLRHYSATGSGDNPMRQANRRVQDLLVPLLASQLDSPRPAHATFEVRVAIQFLVGTLANILLNDPGPLHLEGRKLETHLVRMMRRYLLLPEG